MFDYFNRPFDTFDWALIIGCGILFVGHFIWKIFFSDEGRRKIDNEAPPPIMTQKVDDETDGKYTRLT